MQHCLLSIAVRIHMLAWQHYQTYSHHPASSFHHSFLFFLGGGVFSFPFPTGSPQNLSTLFVADPQGVPCSVCHCLSAQEYQWPAAQSNQSFRGRSTVCLTSASLIIVSKHKPINSRRCFHLAATKTLESYLKPPVFEVIQGTLSAVRRTSSPKHRGDGFLNEVVEKRDYLFWT